MYNSYWLDVQLYYGETYDGNLTRTEEDEVIEVTTEEQLKTRYSSFVKEETSFKSIKN